MKSMTGFGRAEESGEGFGISVEIKSVNNRFLDVNLRLSGELQELESEIKSAVSNTLARGRVDINLQYDRGSEISYELNRPLISGYLKAMKEMQDEFELAGDPDLNVIARLPNALQSKKEDLSPEFGEGVKKAVNDALRRLVEMREKEGDALEADFRMLLGKIESLLPTVESESENVADEYQERLEKRIAKLLSKSDAQIEIDQARLAQEVAYLADKSDISEEVARLKSHIEQFYSIIEDGGVVGKKLDFLTQELNREANTIGSKTQNLKVKEAALGMKAEIEKIREQVQNVE